MKRKDSRSVTRAALYDLIWKRPMLKVAPEFGMSGNGLAKLCRREGIPSPDAATGQSSRMVSASRSPRCRGA